MTRREIFHLGGAHALGFAMAHSWFGTIALAGEPGSDRKDQISALNRFPRMLQRSFTRQIERITQERNERLDRLRHRSDAEAYVASVRAKIRQSFGPFPEKTPLNPRVTGVVEWETYRIEKILFESRPGLIVSANLYLPKRPEGPVPGVIGTCGHSHNGKAAQSYQAFSQGLARQGYAVLIYDPIGQGERLQYVDENLTSRVGSGVREHLMLGNQQHLVGEFFGAWRAWDGIRALDYLLSRDEVDKQQIGVTGNSGGGTMTTWLCGVEQRWTMAAPSCFVTTFRRNLQNELPADSEQCPPKALALGLEHEDFLAALAPKPIIILAKEKDFFDVRGAQLAYERLKRLYRLLDKESNIRLFIGPTPHGYSQENREAMYAFFNSATRISDVQSEPKLQIEKDETLQCTPHGQVSELGARTVWDFTREKSRQLQTLRSKIPPKVLPEKLRDYLRLPKRPERFSYRILRPLSGRGYPEPHAGCYAVRTDPEIEAVVTRLYPQRHDSRPPGEPRRVILYVPHHSSDAELREERLVAELLDPPRKKGMPHRALYAVDLRGIGESRPDTCGSNSYFTPYGSDYFYAAHSIMLDRSLPSQRTHDLMCVLDWLLGLGHRRVHLVAKGWGTIPATFAAMLHEGIDRITLKNNLTSYSDIAESELYGWPLSALCPGVLDHFDLPDCYAALETKGLRQIDPLGAMAPRVEG